MTPLRLRRIRNAIVALAIGMLATALAGELALRFLLFSDSASVRRFGTRLRRPILFSDPRHGDDYWKLQHMLADPERRLPAPNFDPVIGWSGGFVTPGTYEHKRVCPPDGRELILLYGDSFAQCNTAEPDCYPAILDAMQLGGRYCMLNYGVGGYGLDQTYLMVKRSIDVHVDRNPIVIVSMLVDDDLDRSTLTFRCWPKPRFRLVGSDLVADWPVVEDASAFVESHPPAIASYVWRLLTFESRPLAPYAWAIPDDDPPAHADAIELNQAILRAVHQELSSRGLRFFVLLFHMENSIRRDPRTRWQERLVRDTCAELGVPVASTRPFFAAAGCEDAERASRFFGHHPKLTGHHTPLGNAVAFEAIRWALQGRFDDVDTSYVPEMLAKGELYTFGDRRIVQPMMKRTAQVRVRSQVACVRYGDMASAPGEASGDSDRLCLRPGDRGPTHVEFDLAGTARRLTGTLRSFAPAGTDVGEGRTVLEIEVDGVARFRELAPPEGELVRVDIDLTGAHALVITASLHDDGASGGWVCLSDPNIE